MQLDLYQEECKRTADQQSAVLAEVKHRIASGETLSLLEQGGTLHALQVLIENAIGKAKHWLKAAEFEVPVSAYDSLASLQRIGIFGVEELNQWNAAIGLRNRIVHDYMNVDMSFVYALVAHDKHLFIAEFLRRPIEIKK